MRAASRLLLGMACALLMRSGYIHAKGALAGVLLAHAWEESVTTGKPVPPWSWADTYPVGRLVIPSVGYDEVIVDGASPRNMAFGPARMAHASRMAENGNIVLAGHRTSWFLPLKDLKPGDAISVDTLDAQHHRVTRGYHVQSIHIIDPDDTRFIAPSDDSRLTLITCHPFGVQPDSPQRFVVVALPDDVDRTLPAHVPADAAPDRIATAGKG